MREVKQERKEGRPVLEPGKDAPEGGKTAERFGGETDSARAERLKRRYGRAVPQRRGPMGPGGPGT